MHKRLRRYMYALAVPMAVIWCASPAIAKSAAGACFSPAGREFVRVHGSPFDAVASPDECWLFVSIVRPHGRGAVSVLRNHGGVFSLERTLPLARRGIGEALSRDGRFLAVATGDGVTVLSVAGLEGTQRNPRLGRLTTGAGSGAVYATFDEHGRLLFVSDEQAHHISVFDFAKARHNHFTGKDLIGTIPTGFGPIGLALSPNGVWLYVTSQVTREKGPLRLPCNPEFKSDNEHATGLLLRVRVSQAAIEPRQAVSASVPAGCNPVRVAVSPSGQHVWVSVRDSNALWRFDADDLQAKPRKYRIGKAPVSVAVRPDGMEVWATDSDRFGHGKAGLSALRRRVDGTFGKAVQLSVPGFPREAHFLPDGQTLAVTLFAAHKVLLIPTR